MDAVRLCCERGPDPPRIMESDEDNVSSGLLLNKSGTKPRLRVIVFFPKILFGKSLYKLPKTLPTTTLLLRVKKNPEVRFVT